MAAIRRKSLADPAAAREMPRMTLTVAKIGSHMIGYGVAHPGFRWSTHIKPGAGTPSCVVHHLQVFLTGRFGVRMDDGEEVEFGPLDVGDIPPGHDAWVVGDEPWVSVDFEAMRGYGRSPDERRERTLGSVLVTDIVDSTALASRLGPAQWRELVAKG